MKLNKLVSTLNMDHETWLQYRKKELADLMQEASVD